MISFSHENILVNLKNKKRKIQKHFKNVIYNK